MTTERDGTRPDPPLLGSLAYLLMNLPIGIASFVFVVTCTAVGVSTVIIWVGLPILAVATLAWRGAATLERMRVHAMLGTYIASPYRPPADAGLGRAIGARFKDPATYKDMVYHLLMLPIGIAEFTIMITSWATSVWLLLLPANYWWLPGDWYPTLWNNDFLRVDTWAETLPWAALGVLALAIAIALTRRLGTLHARFARAMLGPSVQRIDRLHTLDTAGVIDWSTTAPVTR
ncbi:sensor domain-containing protein [Actinophytocola sediminis]